MKLMPIIAAVVAQMAAATTAFAGTAPPTPVPEPATLAMLAVGVGGLAIARSLRKRK